MKLFLVLCFACLGSQLLAERVFVQGGNGSVSADQDSNDRQSSNEIKSAIGTLIRSSIAREKSFELAADLESADVVLKPSALRLGDTYIFTLDKYRQGQQVYSTTAKSTKLGDLDTVIKRVVKSCLYEKSIKSTAQVDTVTEDETKGMTQKIKASRQYIFGFGPGFVGNLAAGGKLGFGWILGGSWGVDHQASIRFNLEGVNIKDSDAYMFGMFLGMQYYFNKNNNAPYALAQLGYGSAKAEKCEAGFIFNSCESDSGWQLKVGTGYELFRTANVNLGLEAYYATALYDVLDKNPSMYGAGIHLLW